MDGAAAGLHASRRAARSALLDCVSHHPFAVACNALCDGVVSAYDAAADIRKPLNRLVMLCNKVHGAVGSTIPGTLGATETARLNAFCRATYPIGTLLGRAAGGEKLAQTELLATLATLELELRWLILVYPRDITPAVMVQHREAMRQLEYDEIDAALAELDKALAEAAANKEAAAKEQLE